MTLLRVLTVDDEALALRRLKLLLEAMPDIEHVGEAAGCEEALNLIAAHRPDLLLLDIRMRDGTGFDLLERLPRDYAPALIFVTAFDGFAARAFEKRAVDYVLKPVEFARLAEAITGARERLNARIAEDRIAELREIIANLRANTTGDGEAASLPRYETELWIRKSVSGFVRVPVDTIEWVGSEEDYVRLHTRTTSYLMRGSIAGLEERLDPVEFVRIHRKTLVRIAAITELRGSLPGSTEVLLRGGERLHAGRIHARKLRALIRPEMRT